MKSESADVDPSTLYDLQHSFYNGTLFINVTSLVSSYEYCTSASATVYIPRNANIADVVIDTLGTHHPLSPPSSVEWYLKNSAHSKPMNSFTVNAEGIYVTDLQSRNITLHTKSLDNFYGSVECNSCKTQQMSTVSNSATIDNLESFPSTSPSYIPTLHVEATYIDIDDASPAVMNLTAKSFISMTYNENASFYGTLAFRRTVPITSYGSKLVVMDMKDFRGVVPYK